MSPIDDSQFDENERELLRLAHPPIPLDETKLRATLERARQLAVARGPARRRRLRIFFGLGLCAAILAVLPLFGVFGDRGGNGLPATLGDALRVAQNAGDFERGKVQAAMHKLYRVTHRLLAVVKSDPTLDQRTRDAVLATLAAPVGSVRYDGGFEALLDKVERHETLTEPEIVRLTDAARASVAGLRELGDVHTLHAAEIKVLCNYLQQEASPVDPSKTGDQTKAKPRQE